LQGTHELSHAPGPRAEAALGEEAGSGTLADLGEPPRKVRGNWDSYKGQKYWWQTFFGALSITITPALTSTIL